MPRTTIDIDTPVLKELKSLQKKERRSLGQLISQLVTEALARRKAPRKAQPFKWTSKPMRALIDLADKEAVYSSLDEEKA